MSPNRDPNTSPSQASQDEPGVGHLVYLALGDGLKAVQVSSLSPLPCYLAISRSEMRSGLCRSTLTLTLTLTLTVQGADGAGRGETSGSELLNGCSGCAAPLRARLHALTLTLPYP